MAITVRRHVRDGFGFESRVVPGPPSDRLPVALVGGAFQRKESWGRIEEHLVRHTTVITVDLPGWGAADTLPVAYGVNFLAATLHQLLDELGIGAVDIAA